MRIDIVAVRQNLPSWTQQGIQEYIKRVSHHINLNVVSIKQGKRTGSVSIDLEKEATSIQQAIRNHSQVIVLDEEGKTIDSEQFAKELNILQQTYSETALVLGGAEGLADTVKQNANQVWSLSRLTLPHAIIPIGIDRAAIPSMEYTATTSLPSRTGQAIPLIHTWDIIF